MSGATVRKSIRVLTAMGLVSVQHGTASFVTAETDTMVGLSIASVVRLAGVGVTETLGVLTALNRYAAQLAVREATDEEIASMRAAVARLAVIEDVTTSAQALHEYMRRPAELSHNALLGRTAFTYRFARISPGNRHSGMLAHHCAELPYVFGHLDPEQTDEVDAHIAQAVMHAWTEFARTGVPADLDGTPWPRTTAEEPRHTLIGDTIHSAPLNPSPVTRSIHARRTGAQT